MPTVVGVLVEYTRVVLPAIFLIGWRHTLNSLIIFKVVGLPHGIVCVVWWCVCWCIVGCLGHYCPGVAQSLIRSWFV